MKSITELANPDVVIVNGEKFQVLKVMELFYDDINKTIDMCVELTPLANPQMSASIRLIYTKENSSQVSLFVYDEVTDRYLKSDLESLEI